ncbi:transcriptional regulator, TetR family [Anaerovirgula multivorans]|uniref:Transcriptional regulator, TetR family n=1 Tax=Anaerovirgula multivorans TaxID=312168 RepID=A0A239J6P2_9FIRM|nr:TetR/AcrR family transcriptional regulator [Anaerovirgula multivorans]SNT00923.1 transcriptional regulator, TetR family [Anaerovirgula multivorans]
MPTQTFFNLPEEKRNKIIESAINEFSTHSYEAASLNKIVEEAGISKGSMYQYFEDKKDLYLYLLDVAGQIKLSYMQGIIDETDDFFTTLEKVIIASSKFNLEHPGLSQLVINMLSGNNDPFPYETFQHLRQTGQNWVTQLITNAQVNNQIRTDLDPSFLAYLVNQMTIDFGNYLMENNNLTHADMLKGKTIPADTIKNATYNFISVLRDGISVRSCEHESNQSNHYNL